MGKLKDYVNIDNISTWEVLKGIIESISKVDLSNLSVITSLSEVNAANILATQKYQDFTELRNKARSGSVDFTYFGKLIEKYQEL